MSLDSERWEKAFRASLEHVDRIERGETMAEIFVGGGGMICEAQGCQNLIQGRCSGCGKNICLGCMRKGCPGMDQHEKVEETMGIDNWGARIRKLDARLDKHVEWDEEQHAHFDKRIDDLCDDTLRRLQRLDEKLLELERSLASAEARVAARIEAKVKTWLEAYHQDYQSKKVETVTAPKCKACKVPMYKRPDGIRYYCYTDGCNGIPKVRLRNVIIATVTAVGALAGGGALFHFFG